MSPLTDHLQCSDTTSTLLSALLPLLLSGLQRGTASAIPWSKQLESLTQTGLKARDVDVDVCPLPGPVPVVEQQSELSEIKGRIWFLSKPLREQH